MGTQTRESSEMPAFRLPETRNANSTNGTEDIDNTLNGDNGKDTHNSENSNHPDVSTISGEHNYRANDILLETATEEIAKEIVEEILNPENLKIDLNNTEKSLAEKMERKAIKVIFHALKGMVNQDSFKAAVQPVVAAKICGFISLYESENAKERAYKRLITKVGIFLCDKMEKKYGRPPSSAEQYSHIK